jgi:hypothetical protein
MVDKNCDVSLTVIYGDGGAAVQCEREFGHRTPHYVIVTPEKLGMPKDSDLVARIEDVEPFGLLIWQRVEQQRARFMFWQRN